MTNNSGKDHRKFDCTHDTESICDLCADAYNELGGNYHGPRMHSDTIYLNPDGTPIQPKYCEGDE